MPGETGVTVVTNSCAYFTFAREAAGALGIRHSLRPLFSQGERFCKNSGASRRGIAGLCLMGRLKIESVTPTPSSPAKGGRSSIPETPAIESKGRSVLDTRMRGV